MTQITHTKALVILLCSLFATTLVFDVYAIGPVDTQQNNPSHTINQSIATPEDGNFLRYPQTEINEDRGGITDAVCGNGIIEPGEECDGGSECNSSCEEEEEEEGECDASIGDRVWNDKNGNGVQEADEPGISGVKVKLVDGNEKDSDRTDSDGKYKFKNLCEGKVTVVVASETLPDGCWQTYDRDGKLDHTYKRDLEEGENYKKADFGYRCSAQSIASGTVSPQTGSGAFATTIFALLASGTVTWRISRKLS